MRYDEMTREALQEELTALKKEYRKFQGMDLRLDMSRGKPGIDQLNLSMGLMDVLESSSDLTCEDGTDCRNYGQLTGIEEARELIGNGLFTIQFHRAILFPEGGECSR